jgi:hypothetical protein
MLFNLCITDLALLIFSNRIGPWTKTAKFLKIECVRVLMSKVLITRKYFSSFSLKSCSTLIQLVLFKQVPWKKKRDLFF